MYQASLSNKRPASPGSGRVWNHNTGYTGAAGIHSEVGTGTQARNMLMHRRASNAISAEEDIWKKEMKAMNHSRKSLESSMLLYSQKMKDISERRNQTSKKPATPFHAAQHKLLQNGQEITETTPSFMPTSFSILDSVIAKPERQGKSEDREPKNKHLQNSQEVAESSPSFMPTAFSILNKGVLESEKEKEIRNDSGLIEYPTECLSNKGESRMSLDSGICVDSEGYNSDTDLSSRGRQLTARSRSSQESDGNSSHDDTSPRRRRGRGRERIRFRDSKTCRLARVVDEDIKEQDENDATLKEEEEEVEFETPRIAPFPDELLINDEFMSPLVLKSIMEEDLDEFNQNRVLDPFSGKRLGKGGLSSNKGKKRSPYVYFRPKATQSPSLAALRNRFFQRFGPNSVYFRYSEEVLAALRSLSNSPHRQRSNNSSPCRSLSPPSRLYRSISPSKMSNLSTTSPRSSPSLHGVDFEEILQAHATRAGGLARLFFDEDEYNEFFVTKDFKKPSSISRERSFSAPSSKSTQRTSFVSKLEDVKEHDGSKLKPVLKKDESQHSTEKKNVQFFLPDIFMRANICTSQPPDYTVREKKSFKST